MFACSDVFFIQVQKMTIAKSKIHPDGKTRSVLIEVPEGDHQFTVDFGKEIKVTSLQTPDAELTCHDKYYFVPGATYEQYSDKANSFDEAKAKCAAHFGSDKERWLQYYGPHFNCGKFTSNPNEIARNKWEKANGRKSHVCVLDP